MRSFAHLQLTGSSLAQVIEGLSAPAKQQTGTTCQDSFFNIHKAMLLVVIRNHSANKAPFITQNIGQ